jgi:hypothetical protein
MICTISIKIFRDLLHFAYCIAAEVYQGFVAVVATLFPCIVYQLKFETDCIASSCSGKPLCAKGPQLLGTAHEMVHVC